MDLLKVFTWKEEEVFERVAEAINEAPSLTDGENYAFWDRRSPICVQAHIDTVEESSPSCKFGEWDAIKREWIKFIFKKEVVEKVELLRHRNIIGRKNGVLGGDDRAGVMAIISINNTCAASKTPIPLPSILLTNGEETGGTGMEAFIKDAEKHDEELLDPVRVIIALDRRGIGEYVTYSTPPVEVKNYIESFGFNSSHGSWSDAKKITTKWKIPHVNLSIGYYDNHSSRETVHLDETILTAKRVIAMLKDPIKQRYEVEEYKYVPQKWQHTDTKSKENTNISGSDVIPIAAVEKRRKRCEAIQKGHNLSISCICFPYLDYLLTDDAIRQGFHIVSTPESRGKTLEDWYYIFDPESKDETSIMWQAAFGKFPRVYIKTSTHRMFFLAVNGSTEKEILFSSAICENKEREIDEKHIKETEKRLAEFREEAHLELHAQAEEEKKLIGYDTNIEKNYAEQYGYCIRYTGGECDGGCHGNRDYCTFEEGPFANTPGGKYFLGG